MRREHCHNLNVEALQPHTPQAWLQFRSHVLNITGYHIPHRFFRFSNVLRLCTNLNVHVSALSKPDFNFHQNFKGFCNYQKFKSPWFKQQSLILIYYLTLILGFCLTNFNLPTHPKYSFFCFDIWLLYLLLKGNNGKPELHKMRKKPT